MNGKLKRPPAHVQDRPARVMLLAPTTPFLLKTEDNPAGVDDEFFAQRREEWRQDFARWIMDNEGPYFGDGLPGCSVSSLLRDWTKADMLGASLQAVIDFQLSASQTDFRAELSRVGVPTLVVQGDGDASAPLALTGARTADLVRTASSSCTRTRRTASTSPTFRSGPRATAIVTGDRLELRRERGSERLGGREPNS